MDDYQSTQANVYGATIDITDYEIRPVNGSTDTITIDAGIFANGIANGIANTLTWTDSTYSTAYGYGSSHVNVNISQQGVNIKEEADLKIGDRSLKDFMDQVADQLAILRPAPDLESRWHQLRELRRQYEECRRDILEKEKIMSILRED